MYHMWCTLVRCTLLAALGLASGKPLKITVKILIIRLSLEPYLIKFMNFINYLIAEL